MHQSDTLNGLREDKLKQIFAPMLLEMATVTSFECVVKLVETFGGRRLRIGKQPTLAKRLNRLIGEDDTTALCKRFGGELVYVPRCIEALKMARNDEILRLTREGASACTLSQMFGLSERQIYAIRANHKARHDGALMNSS